MLFLLVAARVYLFSVSVRERLGRADQDPRVPRVPPAPDTWTRRGRARRLGARRVHQDPQGEMDLLDYRVSIALRSGWTRVYKAHHWDPVVPATRASLVRFGCTRVH